MKYIAFEQKIKPMKTSLFTIAMIFAFLFSTGINAQNIRQGKTTEHPKLEAQAKKETNRLMQELGLTTKQALLVEDKLVEFLIYKGKILANENLSKEKKAAKLERLNNNKFSEMRDILTDRQYKLYVKMK
jgi:hypothetical protein